MAQIMKVIQMDELIELNCAGSFPPTPHYGGRRCKCSLSSFYKDRLLPLSTDQPSRLMLNVWPAAPLSFLLRHGSRVSRHLPHAQPCACVCVRVCISVFVCDCVCVHPAMCAHKGRRLSLIAQAHLLILGNRLASYRQPRREQKKKQKKTEAQTSMRRICATSAALKTFNLDPLQSAQSLSLWQLCGHH